MIQDFIQVLYHIQGCRGIRGSGMTYRIRLFHIPHNQMRTYIFRQLQPRDHGISTIWKRNRFIKRLPYWRLATRQRHLATDPIEGSGTNPLAFRRIPNRFSTIKSRIQVSHTVWAIKLRVIKEIIYQTMVIRMQSGSHAIMIRESHAGITWAKRGANPYIRQRIQRRSMSTWGIIRAETVHW